MEFVESRLRDHTRTFDSGVRARSASRRTLPAEGILELPTFCYGPYKQDSTSTKGGLVLDQDQCAGCGTDGTSGAIGQGVSRVT